MEPGPKPLSLPHHIYSINVVIMLQLTCTVLLGYLYRISTIFRMTLTFAIKYYLVCLCLGFFFQVSSDFKVKESSNYQVKIDYKDSF